MKRWTKTVALALVVGVSTFVGVSSAFASDSASDSAPQLYERGNWEEAQEEAFLRDDAASMRFRSRFSLWAGDDEDALRFAKAAVEVSTTDGERRRSEAELARLEWFYGERDEAMVRLRNELREAPDDLELRYELGWRLIDDGKEEEGRAILEGMSRRYNDGLITETDDLVWLGRAMKAAQRPRDANRALSRALRQDDDHLEANLRLAQLMMSHHNTAEAERSFKKVLQGYDDHPEALVGMARIEFYRSGRFAKSMELIDRATSGYPGHPEVARGRVELLIAKGAWNEGIGEALTFLERAPDDSQGLSLLAAGSYLRADQRQYEAAMERYDERRSNRPDLLATVGEFAAMKNRHRASVPIFEQALERDPSHSASLAGLGTALTRTGAEARGIAVLNRAYDVDRYRVPVHNMLELYDRGLRDYITEEVDGFRLRAHELQYDVIRDITEPLIDEARQDFAGRYGVELPSLTLEVFADSEAFSVRSVGLPHVDPHGICFGRVVMTRGPGDGDFNWPLVVWHELAHSYHLELSDERVPNWFTEGLAEYETRRYDDSWTRFHDLDLARRVAHDQLWSIAEMDEVFMTGRGIDVAHAYQLAMLVITFLEEEHGFEVVVEMLKGFADTPGTEEVFEAVLEAPIEEVDRRFETWMQRRYSHLLRQELVDWLRLHQMMNDEDVEHHTAAQGSAYRAMVAAIRGERDQARVHLDNARRRGGDEPAVQVMQVLVLDVLDQIEEGLEAGARALDDGTESFDLRYAMSQLAGRSDRRIEAFVHARAATTLAPEEVEGWRQLTTMARAIDDHSVAHHAHTQFFERNPHDAGLARRQLGFFEERRDYHGAYRAARRWTEVSSLDAQAHLARGRAAARSDRVEDAELAWKRAAMVSPVRSDEIWQTAADELRRMGHDARARDFEERIEQEAVVH